MNVLLFRFESHACIIAVNRAIKKKRKKKCPQKENKWLQMRITFYWNNEITKMKNGYFARTQNCTTKEHNIQSHSIWKESTRPFQNEIFICEC